MIACPKCGTKTKVINILGSSRLRQCLNTACNHQGMTEEEWREPYKAPKVSQRDGDADQAYQTYLGLRNHPTIPLKYHFSYKDWLEAGRPER